MLPFFVNLILVCDLQVFLDDLVSTGYLNHSYSYFFLLKKRHVCHELPVVDFSLLVLPKLRSIRILILH